MADWIGTREECFLARQAVVQSRDAKLKRDGRDGLHQPKKRREQAHDVESDQSVQLPPRCVGAWSMRLFGRLGFQGVPPPPMNPEDVARFPLPGTASPIQLAFSPDDNILSYLHAEGGQLTRQVCACVCLGGFVSNVSSLCARFLQHVLGRFVSFLFLPGHGTRMLPSVRLWRNDRRVYAACAWGGSQQVYSGGLRTAVFSSAGTVDDLRSTLFGSHFW